MAENELIQINSPEKQGIEFVEKEIVYCGDKKRIPEDYDRFGSRRECLSKGYGSAYYNADIKQMKTARKKSKKTIKILSKSEVYKLAKRFNIDYKNKDRLDVLKNVIEIFNKMKNNIQNQ